MKKKMLLVRPKSSFCYQDMRHVSFLTNKTVQFMNAALPTIAALTPPGFDVTIVDEAIESINFDEPFDIVGITGFHDHISRAEEIAGEFSRRNVLVVCGGPSVSISPERWRSFADILIIGEAERIWPQFIVDFLNGCHKDEYRETERFDLTFTPLPDYSGFSKYSIAKAMGGIVQTSRGCPHECDFCDIIVYVGRKMRYKPLDLVMQEVEQIYKFGLRLILLADDNFSAGRKNAKKILRALRDWNRTLKHPVKFATQASIDIAKDDEFLELAAEAGLNRVFVGIETTNEESLKETKKFQNVRSNLVDDVKKFHQYGILVLGGCIVGFDHDDLSIFKQQFDFFTKAGIANVSGYPLHAPDGTPLKERIIKEGRYLDKYRDPKVDPKYANAINTFSIMPKLMTLDQLQQGIYWLLWQFYKMENYTERVKVFFENFENSNKKEKIDIPKNRLNREGLVILLKIFKYYFTKATPDERRALKQLFRYARQSSHPQRFEIVIGSFFAVKNIHDMLVVQNPQISQIAYPEQLKKTG